MITLGVSVVVAGSSAAFLNLQKRDTGPTPHPVDELGSQTGRLAQVSPTGVSSDMIGNVAAAKGRWDGMPPSERQRALEAWERGQVQLLGAAAYDPAIVELAEHDAPSVTSHVKVVTIVTSEQSLLCVSQKGRNHLVHVVIPYTAAEIGRPQTGDVIWIALGCADAMRRRAELISMPALGQKLIETIPDTPKYANDKQELTLRLSRLFTQAADRG